MRYLALLYVFTGFFTVSCDNLPMREETRLTDNKECPLRSEENCPHYIGSIGDCVWNIDRCEDKLKETAPKLPAKLGPVKMVAVAHGVAIIDANDELWYIPRWNSDKYIYPHPSKKYRHVAVASDSGRDKICATKLDGTSVCFDDGKEKSGPTKKPVLQTIPASFDDTVCAFSAKELFCESVIKSFEKLDTFSNDPVVQNLAKINPADAMPDIQQIGFLGNRYGYNDKKISVLFANKKLITGIEDSAQANGWNILKQAGGLPWSPTNIISYSAYGTTDCLVDNTPGVLCYGSAVHSLQANIPDDVKAANLSQVATSGDHACVIVKDSGELKCWGSKKLTKNIPVNTKGVNNVVVSERMSCFIDSGDKLICHGENE